MNLFMPFVFWHALPPELFVSLVLNATNGIPPTMGKIYVKYCLRLPAIRRGFILKLSQHHPALGYVFILNAISHPTTRLGVTTWNMVLSTGLNLDFLSFSHLFTATHFFYFQFKKTAFAMKIVQKYLRKFHKKCEVCAKICVHR